MQFSAASDVVQRSLKAPTAWPLTVIPARLNYKAVKRDRLVMARLAMIVTAQVEKAKVFDLVSYSEGCDDCKGRLQLNQRIVK